MSTAPGWYDDGSGRQRYWDGEEWTAHFADSYAADAVAPGRSHRLRALWSAWNSRERWVAIGSAAGTVIGILGLIVPLAVADRAASVDTVGVDSQLGDENGLAAAGDALEPVEAGLSASAAGLSTDAAAYVGWAVPVDAPWEELFALHICEVDSSWDFTARGEADTAAASAWIEQHGIQSPRQSFTATISNTAGSGTITISEIRPQGTLTPAPDRVWVTKPQCGGVGDCSDLLNTRIALGVDPVASFGDPPTIEGCELGILSDITAQPGDPVVFDVAPGEYRPLYLRWTQTADFTGRFVATVTAGGQTSTIDLSPGNADIISPAVKVSATLDLGAGEWKRFICNPDGNIEAEVGYTDNSIDDCTLDEWLAMIGRA